MKLKLQPTMYIYTGIHEGRQTKINNHIECEQAFIDQHTSTIMRYQILGTGQIKTRPENLKQLNTVKGVYNQLGNQ